MTLTEQPVRIVLVDHCGPNDYYVKCELTDSTIEDDSHHTSRDDAERRARRLARDCNNVDVHTNYPPR